MQYKSDRNLAAAQRIIDGNDETYCFASVHCSYYAVLQFMKYLLANVKVNPISYVDQDTYSDSDSHERILNEVRNRMGQNSRVERSFLQTFNQLRRQRKLADYTTQRFTVLECIEIRDTANGLIKNLTSYFNNKIA